MGTPKPEGSTPSLDDLDASWEETEDGDDLDAGWEDEDAPDETNEPPEPDEATVARMTPEENAARLAAKKERVRAKAAAKKERRRARALAAGGKQKQKQPKAQKKRQKREDRVVPRTRSLPAASREVDRADEDVTEDTAELAIARPSRAAALRRDWRRMALLVAILVAIGAAIVFLSKK
jgi:hypothetical protein